MGNISANPTVIDPISREQHLEAHITLEMVLEIFKWETISQGERVVVEVVAVETGR